ncbi:hypothetical protein F5880DRAFT_1494233, partial [Lentinula raphanica]
DRIGDSRDPWGVPFCMSLRSEMIPSTHTAALRSFRKDLMNLTICRGMFFLRSSVSNLSWFTKSKNPLISKVSAVVTKPWFQAA